MKKILLVGRNRWVVDGAKQRLDSESLTVLGALSVDEVQDMLTHHDVDHVFIGPGLDLDMRLEAIRVIFSRSDYTTVHMKDHSTGPEGGVQFVESILRALSESDDATEEVT